MDAFAEGFALVEKNTGNYVAAELGSSYVQDVQNEISKFIQSINDNLQGNQLDAEQLKGFVAEHWHAGTFNIKSVVQGSSIKKGGDFVPRAKVLGSNKFASADMQIDSKINASSKFYKTPAQTFRQQAKTAEDTYIKYKLNGGTDSFEEYLRKRNISDSNAPIYQGQIRLVPKEQLQEIKNFIEKQNEINPEQAKKYEETLKMLSDRLKDGKKVESIPIDTNTAKKLAIQLRESGVTEEQLAEMGITTKALIGFADIARQALQAGTTAAIISIVLKTAPEIYMAIAEFIRNSELDQKQIKKIGFSVISGGAEGFIAGAISSAITSAICRETVLKTMIKSVVPPVIATMTYLTFDIIQSTIKVTTGEITTTELANNFVKKLFIAACSISGGFALSTTPIGTLGLLLGSFIGSLLGSFIYDTVDTAVISFCIDTGFTMFGLVEQNYELPDDVFECIGAEIFKYEEFSYDAFAPKEFSFEKFTTEQFMPQEISISRLRRGVIGVHKIGYIS